MPMVLKEVGSAPYNKVDWAEICLEAKSARNLGHQLIFVMV